MQDRKLLMADECCGGSGPGRMPPPPKRLPIAAEAACGNGEACCGDVVDRSASSFKRVLWAVLAINAAMFAVEIGAGLMSGSASLQADALDFLGDAMNYGLSLMVVGMSLRARAGAALLKGVSMGVVGLWVLSITGWHAWHQTLPQVFTMGAVGTAALLANAASFALLWSHRSGDANMHSAWICTRNDVLGNFAVLLAAAGVFGTSTGWPDLVVAAIMAVLGLQGAYVVIRRALGELAPSALGDESYTAMPWSKSPRAD
jgi:Co/Zn/Cd efflux system component